MRIGLLVCASICTAAACNSNETCGAGTHLVNGSCVPSSSDCAAGASCDCTKTNGNNEVLIDCPGYATIHVPVPAPQQASVVITGNAPTCTGGGVTIQVNDATGVPQSQTVCFAYCGNGTVDAGEQCDDGNNFSFDGCSYDCKNEPECNVVPASPLCAPPRYSISELSAALAPTQGGSHHTIFGDFPTGTAVVSDGVTSYAIVFADAHNVIFVAPPGSGSVTLTLTIDGVTIPAYLPTFGNDGRFFWLGENSWPLHYQPPTVSSVGGCDGCNGGDTLTISGTNFGSAAADISVSVGGLDCTDVIVTTPHTDLSCTLPSPGSAHFDVPIIVTVNAQASAPMTLVNYSGPVIASGSLRLQGQSPISPLIIPEPAPQTIQFDGSFPSPVASVDAIVGDLALPCSPFTVTNAAVTTVTCALDAYFVSGRVRVTTADGALSRLSDDTWVAPNARPIPGSLRLVGGTGSTSVVLPSAAGARIELDAEFVPPRPEWLQASFGGNPCTDFQITPTGPISATVSCALGFGSGSGPLEWTVLGQTAIAGTDTVNYPVALQLSAVSGCDADFGGEARGCPTEGGNQLTLTGSGFLAPLQVTVGPNFCDGVTVVSSTELTCTLPPGIGDAPVRVLGSQPSNLVGLTYAAPHIDSAGCFGVSDCSPGEPITLNGTNFGASGGTLLIGASECENAQHAVDMPHRRITCNVPFENGINLPVYFVNGGVSNVVYVSVAFSD